MKKSSLKCSRLTLFESCVLKKPEKNLQQRFHEGHERWIINEFIITCMPFHLIPIQNNLFSAKIQVMGQTEVLLVFLIESVKKRMNFCFL